MNENESNIKLGLSEYGIEIVDNKMRRFAVNKKERDDEKVSSNKIAVKE